MKTDQGQVVYPKQAQKVSIKFDKPPVAETSIGFYFPKIEGWDALYYGALWVKFRSKYPEHEFLPPVVDALPQLQHASSVPIDLLPIRVGFSDKAKSQLIQLQNGFFLRNWRRNEHNPKYPGYEIVQSRLREDWAVMKAFLAEMSLKEPIVERCQIDYFNHLVRGQEWNEFSDVPKIFNLWHGVEGTEPGLLQMVSFATAFKMDRGTVNTVVQPAIRSSDGKELIQLTVSSSIAPQSSKDSDLFNALDECHESAGRVLLSITTQAVREKWEQK